MMATDHVHIKGPGPDLQFSIKGIKAITFAAARTIFPTARSSPRRSSTACRASCNTMRRRFTRGSASTMCGLEFKGREGS